MLLQTQLRRSLTKTVNHTRFTSSSSSTPSSTTDQQTQPQLTNFPRKTTHAHHHQERKPSSFVDLKCINVASGKGGDGSIHFFKGLVNPNGPPCGGNGGRGGDVWIVASKEVTSLGGLLNRYKAPDGAVGQRQNMHGKDAEEVEIIVPVGTLVRQPPIFLDLSTDGERHLIVRGGRGGFGNPHFTSNEIKGPGIASRGEKGKNIWLELELKTIADAGLVGLPNAGKSTLLKRITNANPKIASYPFTTLNPYVGTIEYPDSHTITVADIPGLVAGAHLNVGLGHEFLRHVERSNVLVYVVDLGGLDAGADFLVLRDELERYKQGLSGKPSLVIANKADLGQIAKENLKGLREAVGKSAQGKEMLVVPVSARDDKNIGVALAHLRKLVDGCKVVKDGDADALSVL
ncbi:GTP-binding protein Obg/CgtA [Rhizoclosmatium globosum]|uniref:GTP-binding protein Obg/CgtA n=1 Tax=Rhizoclosmatium globosum TaxID=329046 RepID=A0A1Y2BY72_9FUNG|nr:GTP-binding protein Obg/CgtA [Rhizoclosmatium globosum]|eukprot:ORY39015.1 GTP-binding protein Obg/CgtA [Rhizoclosmatium globosum]